MKISSHQVRLASGLVLFVYVALHLANHALMNVSLAAAETYAFAMFAIVGLPPVRTLLYLALAVHFGLALWAIYRRRDLATLSRGESVQLVAGLLVVPILMGHVVPVRFGALLFGALPTHTSVAVATSQIDTTGGLLLVAGLLLVWLHGCTGVHYWLRLKPFYRHWQPWLLAAAAILAALALAGYLAGSREAEVLFADPEWRAGFAGRHRLPSPENFATIERIKDGVLALWALSIAFVFAARRVRAWHAHRGGRAIVAYPGDTTVAVARGTTLLEASRQGRIAHASVCGGRGRCSTCRVRIERGADNLSLPAEDELAVLSRVAAPPGVRLACQARAIGDVAIVPLLPASIGAAALAQRRERESAGAEKTIAVMFADLRGFTTLSESKLPFDVVFLLNRYFAEMGAAIEASGGRIDKFVGDGIVALFGVESGPAQGTREALAGARAMIERLAALNAALAHDLDAPLRIGIGIHTGPAIVGEMGYSQARQFTAIGDTVNTASRLEALTKKYAADLLVSSDAALASGLDFSGFPEETTDIRGRQGVLAVRIVQDATKLA
ncbi:MAG: adenylate/guanylate cyclase domain-containing protein [Telmatospirillum sp.]|nr:adenylate/guanylate cyclase domain-containing protein [Telmatospirillum sp.]